ncbi:hypothetical protein HanRHA438_Chr12g0566481 [Helianthus annuus]|uniref:Uncharacterized protein n=1 Tax=Helianthus annuus TaxID=4232 RepID=A0A251T3R5_HELAN|nr:hypothetical protein HanXRQr2_Chr12g0555051 [Helianthus annuus]KAJ0494588.1 hypothetical protein HanIR_Chr12g0599171 [Helianthus annuus]KAJ0679230.1 hypothetical protein HanOQP8_Chr12g0457021 [Helianthus annuus]KAJ0863815.1 hypothetical protein HanPSC8_Chr12g0534421 [Helianthus annuus]KAJ0867723.1 hypothetical protein HanRHA438_Chr12g0566481 [Helianthus annuus]
MMYKSFKHKKTSLSSYTLLLKKHGIPLGFHLHSFISKHFKIAAFCSSLSLSGDSSGSRICLHGEYQHISSPIKPKIPNPIRNPKSSLQSHY